MSETTAPLRRAWNSWDSMHPAEMQFLPLGLRITPCAYAASANAFTRFPMAEGGVRLGPRAIDAESARLDLIHAGTTLALTYDKPDPFTLRGAWRAERMGEWGLRFWVVLILRMAPPALGGRLAEWRFDAETGTMTACVGARHVVLRGERPPLLATFHESIEAVGEEFESKGYFYLESRGTAGPVAALRYNLEEMPRFRFVATLADGRELALQTAATWLEEGAEIHPHPDPPPSRGRGNGAVLDEGPSPWTGEGREGVPHRQLPTQTGPFAGALDAVRDVIGWNTVWDPVNWRPYATASRNWVGSKFGGFGVWLNDALYHALMAGLFDAGLARENLEAVLAGATPEGNLPCLVTGRDAWVDRSQPPIGSFIVWMLYSRSGARDLLTLAYEALRRNHEWWWRMRDGNGSGLVAYGTSPVGTGLYRGTKLAAKDESSMDNSPVHDEAVLDPDAGTLDCADVGLNSLLALDGEMLARIARELGDAAEAERLDGRARALRERIRRRLWDAERGVFANRLWSGRFVRSLAPTSFYPLLAGAADRAQAEALVALLRDGRKFGGPWLLPSVARDDPAFADNVYWRGRIWPPLSFLVYHGLRRYGFEAEATALADNGYRLFMGEWEPHRRCPENFNAVTGAACDQPDTDGFYGWGALLPLLGVAETMDVTPWHGWEITHGDAELRLGPVSTPAGAAVLSIEAGWLTLAVAGGWTLRSNLPGRSRRLRLDADSVRLSLPPVSELREPRWLELRRDGAGGIALARIGGRAAEPAVEPEVEAGTFRFRLPASAEETPFELFLGPGRMTDAAEADP